MFGPLLIMKKTNSWLRPAWDGISSCGAHGVERLWWQVDTGPVVHTFIFRPS